MPSGIGGGRPREVRLAVAALAFLVAVVATLGTWQVFAARSSQTVEIENGEVSSAHLASSALGSALSSALSSAQTPKTSPVCSTGPNRCSRGKFWVTIWVTI